MNLGGVEGTILSGLHGKRSFDLPLTLYTFLTAFLILDFLT